jgi:hypothetical protein
MGEVSGETRPVTNLKNLFKITAVGVAPRLSIIDVRADGISKALLWPLFNLSKLNATLSEVSSQAGEEVPQSIDVRFPAGTVHNPDCVVKVLLKNPGKCDVDWRLAFPYEDAYNPSHWAVNDSPSEEEAQLKKYQDHKVFEISPSNGCLKPDQTAVVEFRYKHLFVGDNSIEMSISLNGKSVYRTSLTGTTSAESLPHLQFIDLLHEFEPVAIGAHEVPTQEYRLNNTGDADAHFSLDLSALDDIREENYGFSIFECGTASGIVPAKGSVTIPWRFHPLEAKEYKISVPIRLEGLSDVSVITMKARGYQPEFNDPAAPSRLTNRQRTMHSFPYHSCLTMAGQMAQLSVDGIDFGVARPLSVSRRVVFVSNRSKDHVIRFQWQTDSLSSVVKIYPESGLVEPGAAKICRVTFSALDGVRLYDHDIRCEVYDQTVLDQYYRELEAASQAIERQKHEFVLTDKGRTGNQRAGAYLDKTASGNLPPMTALPLSAAATTTWKTGFQPSYTVSLSNQPLPDASALTRFRTNQSTALAVDSEIRTKRYVVCRFP